MKLVYPDINMELSFPENQVNVISIENQRLYSSILSDLWCQGHGNPGELILSEDGKPIKFQDAAICIYNPFDIEINEKKPLSIIYKELSNNAHDMLPIETAEFMQHAVVYMDRIINTSPYDLSYEASISPADILKLFHVMIQSNPETLLEALIDYVKVQSRICNISLFIFQNLKYYLTTEDLYNFYEFAFYEKAHILIIEAIHSPTIDHEKSLIIDKDCCIIEVN